MARRESIKEQTAVIIDSQLINTKKIKPADLIKIKEDGDEVFCATCKQTGQLVVLKEGPVFKHSLAVGHDPEDMIAISGKKILFKRFLEMFPNATVNQDIFQGEQLIDYAVIWPNGGKVIINYFTQDNDFLEKDYQLWADEGVKMFVISDWRRLLLKSDQEVASVTLGKTETSLIKLNMPLIYFDIEKRNLIKVTVPEIASKLIKLNRVSSLGRLNCLIRRYSLSQFRLINGAIVFESDFYLDDPPPAKLPKRLIKKWQEIKKVRPRDLGQ
jgi:hypothetical protein